jgi:hypothetical protein
MHAIVRQRKSSKQYIEPMQVIQAGADIERARRLTIDFMALIAFLFVAAHLFRLDRWAALTTEFNAWSYGTALMWFTVGELAVIDGILLRYLHKLDGADSGSRSWMAWMAAGLAFVYFSFDDMLTIHELLGTWIEDNMPGLMQIYRLPSDTIITSIYALSVGALLIVFFRIFAPDRRIRTYLLIGAAAMVAKYAVDAIPRQHSADFLAVKDQLSVAMQKTGQHITPHMMKGAFEGVTKMFGGLMFASAFISAGALYLARILQVLAARTQEVQAAKEPQSSEEAQENALALS